MVVEQTEWISEFGDVLQGCQALLWKEVHLQTLAHQHQKHRKIIHQRYHQLSQTHALPPAQLQGRNHPVGREDPQGKDDQPGEIQASPDLAWEEPRGAEQQEEEKEEMPGNIQRLEVELV